MRSNLAFVDDVRVMDGDQSYPTPATKSKSVTLVQPRANVMQMRQRDPWRDASESQRSVAVARMDVVSAIERLEKEGRSTNAAVALLLARVELGELHPHLKLALRTSAKADRATPSRASLFEWRKMVAEGASRIDFLDQHKGRVRNATPAWWGPAIEYFNQPSKPDMSAVWRRLTEVDSFLCTYDQVRGYLTSIPAQYGRHSPARLGRNLYKLTEKAYIKRSTQNALAGDVYVADGYRADIYLAHPVTGKLWRPELTVALDLRSRYPVGWRADEHEGTVAVQNMWAESFVRHNHVPPFLYVDNGSGHKNKLMSDEVTGFYTRAGIQQIIHAIPGNPHGKGWVERFFRTMRDDFLKMWLPLFYCGDDVAPESKNKTAQDIIAGRIQAPSLGQFSEALNAWMARYVQRAHPEDSTKTIAQMWATLVPLPPAIDLGELKRQAVQLTVHRGMIKHGKRHYRSPDLLAYNGVQIVFEYDLMDDKVGVVKDQKGRWICDAALVHAIDVIAPNRLEEKRQLRAADALKRIDLKRQEALARAGHVIDVEATATSAAQFLDMDDFPALDAPEIEQGDDTPLNFDHLSDL